MYTASCTLTQQLALFATHDGENLIKFRRISVAGSYGTIDLNVAYDEANFLLVVNILKARVRKFLSKRRLLLLWNQT